MSSASKLAKPYRIEHGKNFRLKNFDPAATAGIHSHSKEEAQKLLDQGIKELSELQDKLYAQDNWALLLMFQGMDAAGKDGAIKHVMSGVNPQGCQVYSFKQPSPEELNHDYLWRSSKVLPERGRIGIFNRSYYEEVLVTRVHSEILKNERIPAALVGKNIWEERYEDIRNLEHYLSHNGIVVRKFFLNISKKEQKRRFLERLETPAKNWKFSASDLTVRQSWDEYMKAFEEMIAATSTKHSPWYVVPADNKWYTRLVVAAAVVDTLKELKLAYPTVDAAQRKQLAAAKKELLRKK
jgi:PPK2 family polyphosphate:nucleotide phosphotransferase